MMCGENIEPGRRITMIDSLNSSLFRNPIPYPTYKPSGVEWLGEVPAHWELTRVRNHYAIKLGKMLQNNPNSPNDIEVPYLRAIHVQWFHVQTAPSPTMWANPKEINPFGIAKGDLLVCEGGEGGRCGIIETDVSGYIIQNALHRVRPREGSRNEFLQYVLSTAGAAGWFDALNSRATIGHFTSEKFSAFKIPLPPLPEQRAIAAFLDRETAKIDALVTKKERLIELLQEKRTTLISHAVTGGLDPDVRLKDSGVEWLGEIPEHWEVKRLKHVLRLHRGAIKAGPFGSQLKNTEMMVGDIKVYNQRSVIDHDFTVGHNYISVQKFEELRAFEVFPNDILITTRGTIGKCAIIPVGSERGILHPCLIRIQFDSRRVHGRFAEVLIQDSVCVLGQLKLKSNATTIAVIYSESLREAWLALPPLPEQRTIAAFLDRETERIDALVAKVREAIDRLKELRVSLISAAVTGRIDVREEAGCS